MAIVISCFVYYDIGSGSVFGEVDNITVVEVPAPVVQAEPGIILYYIV